MGEFIKKYRNPLLFAMLLVTMAASYFAQQKRLTEETTTVSLPIEQVETLPTSKLEEFRQKREETLLADMAALQALCDQEKLDDQTRQDAANQLQSLVSVREKQLALEGALTESGVYPCVAVVSDGSVTIVTEKSDLSSGESALVMTLAKAHADVAPSGVRVITAQEAK